jgi:membrane protein implicated in regulation of membrane protease activity
MRRFVRENSLALVFLLFFVLAVAGQAFAGWHDFNDQAMAHHEPTISLGRYITSSEYGNAVLENWQSEFLQFTLYILLTVWFVQRGSPESKQVGKEGGESDQEQLIGEYAQPDSPRWARVGGWRTRLYSNSLVVLMVVIWVLCWFGQSVTGWSQFNSDQLTHHESTVNWLGYLGTADFWQATLQNWQSEFLAVGSMAVFSIYLRQRGSPESKPVGASHESTGVEG